jgi:hypothetical protein
MQCGDKKVASAIPTIVKLGNSQNWFFLHDSKCKLTKLMNQAYT